jgi:plasmid stabilization system protein ParE
MDYKVVLTDTAKQDLRAIAFYITEESKDKDIAKRFVNELREETSRLGTLPNAGALPRDRILKSLGYRYLVHKEYLTFYLVDEQQKKVFVMAIFNGKRDYMRVMRKLI